MSKLNLEKRYKCVGVYHFNYKGELLLINHFKRGWGPPGGFTENSDLNTFKSAQREFFEETLYVMPNKIEKQYNKCEFGPSCMLFVSMYILNKEECSNIIKNYSPSRVKNKETLDIAFYSLDQLFTKQKITGNYGTCNKTASFLARALRRLKAKGFLNYVISLK